MKYLLVLIYVRLNKPRDHGVAGRLRYVELYSVTSWGVEPVAFWLVALSLNHLY
jgi:hypothetical protein